MIIQGLWHLGHQKRKEKAAQLQVLNHLPHTPTCNRLLPSINMH